VGGAEFFKPASPFVEIIPSSDIPDKNDLPLEPPPSLLRAIELFIIGSAVGFHRRDTESGRNNRSMMIHPSHLKNVHAAYFRWAQARLAALRQILGEPEDNPDRRDLMSSLHEAYTDLGRTEADLPPFEHLERDISLAVQQTLVSEMNARAGKSLQAPNWTETYSHVLVGGQALDRGFTVRGLTVTYMPRGPGVGNADTIQQRGRFFGYKRSYLGLCRLFLEHEVETAFQAYIEHEEQMRYSIKNFLRTGRPLKEWKRIFFLDEGLKPTRDSVLSIPYMRVRLKSGWTFPWSAHASPQLVQANRDTVDQFTRAVQGRPYREKGWSDDQAVFKYSSKLPLSTAVENLLAKLSYADEGDTLNLTILTLLIEKVLRDQPHETCSLYVMKEHSAGRRAIGDDGKLKALFQGANPRTNYPGAEKLREDDRVTIQLHRYDIHQDQKTVCEDVPIIAVYVPRRLRSDFIAQEFD
jgi:hypothetical protein